MALQKERKDMRSSNPVLGRAFNQRGYAAFDPSTINSDPAALENLYNSPASSSIVIRPVRNDDAAGELYKFSSAAGSELIVLGSNAAYPR